LVLQRHNSPRRDPLKGTLRAFVFALLALLALCQPLAAQTADTSDTPVLDTLSKLSESFPRAFLTGAAAAASAVLTRPELEFQGTIANVEVLCDLPFCDDLNNVDTLERVTGLWDGQEYNLGRIIRGQERLLKTGYFATIAIGIDIGDDGAKVTYDTVGQPIVRTIAYDEIGSLFETELDKRLFLRPGRPLLPRSSSMARQDSLGGMDLAALAATALADQKESIRQLYESEGYYDAVVEITTVEPEPYLVDLHIRVDQGRAYALGKVYIRGHETFEYDRVESELRSEFGFFSNFTKEQLSEGTDAIIAMYRREGFIQARVRKESHKAETRGVFDVYLDIDENARWAFAFKGNVDLGTGELLDVLTFFEAGFIDEAEILNSMIEIKALYETSGHYWAEVTYDVDEPTPGLFQITFTIDEGPRSEIEAVEFLGNTVLSADELLAVIASQPYQAFGTGAYPQLSLIAADAATIVKTYQAKGYLLADVPEWSLLPTKDPNFLILTFTIVEGPKTVVTKRLEPEFDKWFTQKLSAKLETKVDLPLDPQTLSNDARAILRPYRRDGFARAEVAVKCSTVGASPGSEDGFGECRLPQLPDKCVPANPIDLCQREAHDGVHGERCQRHFENVAVGTETLPCVPAEGVDIAGISVRFAVEQGNQHSVGDFFIHGNFVTKESVIRQDIPFERKEPFDINALLEARGHLRARSIFRSVTVEAIGLEDSSDPDSALSEVPLVISVEEGDRRWIDMAIGTSYVSSEWLATAELEFVEANLLGMGWELSLLFLPEFRFLNNASEFVLAKSFNQNWFSLLTFKIPLSPAKGIDLLFQAFYDLRYIPDTQKEEQGGVAELRWSLSRKWFAAVAFEAKLSATRPITVAESYDDPCFPFVYFQECGFDPRLQTYSVIPRTIYDARDSPLNPTKGFHIEGKVKLGFFEDVGIFAKPDVRGSYYNTFLSNFTLGVNARVGFAMFDTQKSFPLFERYFLGGINVRGFDIDGVGARFVDPDHPELPSNDSAGGEFLLNTSVDLRFPILKDIGIYGVLFWDVGSLLVNQFLTYPSASLFFEDLFINEMRHTAGIGLRWLIAENLPPIVFDYGIILNRRIGEPFGGLHINVGYTF